jgi:CubicO group peptidase (beta-lactamase class C family)
MSAGWQARLNALAGEFEVPGASLAIWHNDRLDTCATGVVNLNTAVAATPNAIFQIGSITKLLTATLVMQLVEDGRLHLDDPVRRHLPDFSLQSIDAARAITIRQLLTHTSGIDGDFFENTGLGEDKLARYVDSCRVLPTLHPPGELFSYCNVGFNLLGRIIELQRGTTWETALDRHLCGRLGANSFVRYPHDTPKYRTAIGHVRAKPTDALAMASAAYLPLASAPAGSVVYASAADLILFARSILDGGISPIGEQLLARQSLEQMLTPQVTLPPGGLADAFGLAFMLFHWDHVRVIGHDGATTGQNAYLRIVPSRNTAVALLTNGGFPAELYRALFAEIFGDLLGIRPPPRPSPTMRPIASLDAYCGVFEKLSQRITVRVDGDHLVATIEGVRYPAPPVTYRLRPCTGDTFVGTLQGSPTPVVFHYLTTAAGARLLMTGGRVHPRRAAIDALTTV